MVTHSSVLAWKQTQMAVNLAKYLLRSNRAFSGMPQLHSYRTAVKNKMFSSVIIVMVEQYVVTEISTESITLTMGGATVIGLAPVLTFLALFTK